VPNSVLIVDGKNVTAVVSFYGTNNQLKEKVQSGDLCYIKDPQVIFTSITFQGRMYAYQCIKVHDLSNVLVNDGQPLVEISAGVKLATTQFI
jgi:hypothetical protein